MPCQVTRSAPWTASCELPPPLHPDLEGHVDLAALIPKLGSNLWYVACYRHENPPWGRSHGQEIHIWHVCGRTEAESTLAEPTCNQQFEPQVRQHKGLAGDETSRERNRDSPAKMSTPFDYTCATSCCRK